jgi:DNA-binding IclR family transcriptional regulator
MQTEDFASRYRAPALDKGLDILELLAASDESYSQAEIAKALGRSPNEIYRMLDRLVRRGYVHKISGERYELSLKIFALSHQHAPMRRLVSQSIPVMRRFARAASQSCHLAVYDRGGVTVVAQIDSPTYWGLSIRVGARVSLFNTGSGHVLLAFKSPRERAFMLAEHEDLQTGRELPPAFEAQLAQIRQQGYESMPSLQIEGVQNLSVPLRGPEGSSLAAFTCPFVKQIDSRGRPDLAQVIDLLKAAGQELSQLIADVDSLPQDVEAQA